MNKNSFLLGVLVLGGVLLISSMGFLIAYPYLRSWVQGAMFFFMSFVYGELLYEYLKKKITKEAISEKDIRRAKSYFVFLVLLFLITLLPQPWTVSNIIIIFVVAVFWLWLHRKYLQLRRLKTAS